MRRSPPELGDFAPERAARLRVRGCEINWLAWGDRGDPIVLLVHGARANWHWWHKAAGPLIGSGGRRILAMDLSGHGDSGHRPEYSGRIWAEEVAAVIASQAGGAATVVGHSMGGFVAIAAAACHPGVVDELVLVDVPIQRPDPLKGREPLGVPARPLRSYGSRREAVESFRLLPSSSVTDEDLVREVAAVSVAEFDGGWQWKFDPEVAQRFDFATVAADLVRVRCDVRALYGAESDRVSAATIATTEAILEREVPAGSVPGAGHHVVLDRPLQLGAALDRVLPRA